MTELTEAEYQRRKAIYDDHMEKWQRQRKIQLEAEERFNKNIFIVAAGSFGVSFAFIDQIVPVGKALHPQILIIAWVLMGLTVLLSIIEILVTYFVQDKLLNNIELNIERGYRGQDYIDARKTSIMLPDRLIKCIMLICFFAGIACLLLFVYKNFGL